MIDIKLRNEIKELLVFNNLQNHQRIKTRTYFIYIGWAIGVIIMLKCM